MSNKLNIVYVKTSAKLALAVTPLVFEIMP